MNQILELAEWYDEQAKLVDDNVAFYMKNDPCHDADQMDAWSIDAARHRATAALLRELNDKKITFAIANREKYDEMKWDMYASSLNTGLESKAELLLQEIKS